MQVAQLDDITRKQLHGLSTRLRLLTADLNDGIRQCEQAVQLIDRLTARQSSQQEGDKPE